MTVRQRKLIGVLIMLAILVGYAVVAASLAEIVLGGAPTLVQILYYAAAGLLWVVPAGLVIRWMQRPDADGGG